MTTDDGVLLKANGLTRTYRRGSEEIVALDTVSLEIRRGEFVTFTGPSGSGKTTLLNLLGCLDNPTAGELELAGEKIFGGGKILSERKLSRIRRRTFGYIFQNFYLIPTLTVLENVTLPLAFFRKSKASGEVERLLTMLGMEHRMHHLPEQISGGEMQRVAIARALIHDPDILIGDEPTGNLDPGNTAEILEILLELHRAGKTIILATHDEKIVNQMKKRVITFKNGQVFSDIEGGTYNA